jgi:hypothetical protein
MRDQHSPVAEGEPVQAAISQRKLLMGRQPPHRSTGEAALEGDKGGGTVRQGQVHQGIRLTPTVCQVQQGQDGIQDRAHDDQERKHDGPARQTIDIHLASLSSTPKACAPALPAQRTPERRGARTAVCQAAPVKRQLHIRCSLQGVFAHAFQRVRIE